MLPSKVIHGQRLTADFFNRLIESIRECQIQSGAGYSFKRGSGGTVLQISQQFGKPKTDAIKCPFDVSVNVTTSQISVSIEAGLINGILPSNIFTSITANLSGKKYVAINCETDGKNVVSASWGIQTGIPSPAQSTPDVAPASFGVLVSVISGSDVFRAIPCQNILARVTPTIQEDSETYVAGKRNFIQYYNWIF